MLVERPLYLKKIEPFIDAPLVKILVGIRRAGKSSLLGQVSKILHQRGIAKSRIIRINFEDLRYTEVRTKAAFTEMMLQLMNGKNTKRPSELSQDNKKKQTNDMQKYYILLDEVQLVEGWDEVVNGLLASGKADIYITGSNSKLLSSELSTYLTGRYVNIKVYPLNFSEALEFKQVRGLLETGKTLSREQLAKEFRIYRQKGGFPILHTLDYGKEDGDKAVEDIYTSIIYRDLIERKKIRNTELLTRIIKYIFDNVGNIFSARSIASYVKNELRTVDVETVYNYLDWLAEVFVIQRVGRYDLRRKTLLQVQEKYYLGDIGLLYALNGRKDTYLPGILENLVYLELLSRGYKVYIGKNGDREIDFVAEKQGKRMYLQVVAHMYEQKTIEREYSAFAGIEDNYPKYILTLDEDSEDDDREGIEKKYLPEFLLGC